MLKAVANNAVGFAFSLAIDTVCPECSKIMQEFSQKAQLMNNPNINSCEMAQGLVGGLWPKSDLADKAICESIGNCEGHLHRLGRCQTWLRHQGPAGLDDGARRRASTTMSTPGSPRNYTWHVLKKSAFFSPGGTLRSRACRICHDADRHDYLCAAKRWRAGHIRARCGRRLVDAGDRASRWHQGHRVQIWDCDETDKCLNPDFKSLALPVSKALRPRVAALIDHMVQAIHNDTADHRAQMELLQVASLPLYKILTVQAAYGRGMPTDDRETLAEIASVDLLFAVLDRMVSELAGRSRASSALMRPRSRCGRAR